MTLETDRLKNDCPAFVEECCHVEDKVAGGWLPFALWDAQREFLTLLCRERFVVALKPRQIGYTWLAIAKALHELVFRGCTVLLFSQTDLESQELMRRLVEMWRRLPAWVRPAAKAEPSRHELLLRNGGQALAFATTKRSGRSFTAGLVLVDEADFITDLPALLNAVKPTVDMGGQLVLISTSDKSKQVSQFKSTYRAAKQGKGTYKAIFHGWRARPGRTDEWYAAEVEASIAETGSLDRLHQEYPATDEEALAPASSDKRIAAEWLRQCYQEMQGLRQLPRGAPSIPGFIVYRPPLPSQLYVVSGDPAEGNPTSDDSAMTVLDARSGEECAMLAGKLQPAVLAEYIHTVGMWYNHAPAMVERNNHGHAVIQWLLEHGRLPLLCGHDGRIGWLSSIKGKALLYEACADAFRCQETILHSFSTLCQLQSIEGNTLRAPEGEHDDEADAYALAIVGCTQALIALSQEDVGDVVAVT